MGFDFGSVQYKYYFGVFVPYKGLGTSVYWRDSLALFAIAAKRLDALSVSRPFRRFLSLDRSQQNVYAGFLWKICLLACLLALTSGCSWQSGDGRGRTHLVLGLGVIETRSDMEAHAVGEGLSARALRMDAAGLVISTAPGLQGVSLGVQRRQTVEIDQTANLLLEVLGDQSKVLRTMSAAPPAPFPNSVSSPHTSGVSQ